MYEKKDLDRSLRLIKVFTLLVRNAYRGGLSIEQLAEECSVSSRQIYSDLKNLRNDLHIGLTMPEESDGPEKGKVCLTERYLPSISPEKALTILLSLFQQQGSALDSDVTDFQRDLAAVLFKNRYSDAAKDLSAKTTKVMERFYIVGERLATPQEVEKIFLALVQSVIGSYCVKIWYRDTKGGKSERVVEPWGLICKNRNWYLVGFCRQRQDKRTFRVDQIEHIRECPEERFVYPDNYSLREDMQSSWGVVVGEQAQEVGLHFKAKVADRVKRMQYHVSQKLAAELPDGSIIISFQLCGFDELITWLMQWGDAVEVIAPDWLRRNVAEEGRRIHEIYQKAGPDQ